jgi:5-methylcytosine-specific restriction endonuclease McrA
VTANTEPWTGSKRQRAALWARFDGRCGYCGQPMERMQADHIQPVIRITTDPWGRRLPAAECRMILPERNTVANMMPACAGCNLHKGGHSLEEWRALLARAAEVLARDKSIFRAAVRLGTITVNPGPIVFHFEKVATS